MTDLNETLIDITRTAAQLHGNPVDLEGRAKHKWTGGADVAPHECAKCGLPIFNKVHVA